MTREQVQLIWRAGLVSFALGVSASLTYVVLDVIIGTLGGPIPFIAIVTGAGAGWGLHHAIYGDEDDDS